MDRKENYEQALIDNYDHTVALLVNLSLQTKLLAKELMQEIVNLKKGKRKYEKSRQKDY